MQRMYRSVPEARLKQTLNRLAFLFHQPCILRLVFQGFQDLSNTFDITQIAAKVIQPMNILRKEPGILILYQQSGQFQMAELFWQQCILLKEGG